MLSGSIHEEHRAMAGPFPGMDPWLEHPSLWPGVHTRLITYVADELQIMLGGRYVAAIEERLYISTADRTIVPDVVLRRSHDDRHSTASTAVIEPDEALVVELVDDEVHEPYIEILDRTSGQQVVTVIELLSSSNKEQGEGRSLYLKKQQEVLSSSANLVEIDLLRGGLPGVAVSESDVLRAGFYDYLVAISRARDRQKRSLFYSRTVRDRLPRIAIPLQASDADITLDLQPLLNKVYEAGQYGDRIQYSKPCIPRLRPDDEIWARDQIALWQAARHS
jgi:hypothetical protein